ncbi:amidohydrolase family protein [Labrys wisconsinensis]|uniref:L-fuconolactonase n=1 Tax=Labrys wisconsinensis TaxID=425677 RepID=A0ABU0J364_9HYPH|nr:amidohydrolase family protein [Labrys wisconsinensis]MDQ0468045.1 L-fuconolactonase [Labrys wisconsinensis]
MPNFPIIDAHVHLYDVERLSYGWLAGVPAINRTHLLPDFDAARGPVAVEGLVFAEVAVDPGLHLAEAAFVQGLADADPRLIGMVAHAPVEKGAAVEEDILALKANRSLCGIRRLIQSEADPSFCLAPGFLEGLSVLARHGLPFDICIKHWAMAYALELARRCPDVQFVLDHIGKPDIRYGLREPWWREIRELARCPNVVVKLSGVVTEADHARWTPEDVKPYVAHVVDCFGFERLMFGSDWSVSALTHPYPAWVAIVDEVIRGAGEAEQRSLYRDTALRTYRLTAPGA